MIDDGDHVDVTSLPGTGSGFEADDVADRASAVDDELTGGDGDGDLENGENREKRMKYTLKFMKPRRNFLDLCVRGNDDSSHVIDATVYVRNGVKDYVLEEEVKGSVSIRHLNGKVFVGIVKEWHRGDSRLVVRYDDKRYRLSVTEQIIGTISHAKWEVTRPLDNLRDKFVGRISDAVVRVSKHFPGDSVEDVEVAEETMTFDIAPVDDKDVNWLLGARLSNVNTRKLSMYVESNIYSHMKNKMHHRIFSKYSKTRLSNKSSSIDELLLFCDERVKERIKEDIDEIEEKNANSLCLEADFFSSYKSEIRKVVECLSLFEKELETYPCNSPSPDVSYDLDEFFIPQNTFTEKRGYHFRVGERGRGLYKKDIKSRVDDARGPLFNTLNMVEKTLVTWNIFVRQFFTTTGGDLSSLRTILSIPGWSDELSDCEKNAKRAVAFENLSRFFPFREMVSLFIRCLHHYGGKPSWRRDAIVDFLSEHFWCILPYWFTMDTDSFIKCDSRDVFIALDRVSKSTMCNMRGNFYVDALDINCLKDLTHRLGTCKKSHIENFCMNVLCDRGVATLSASEMRVHVLEEQHGVEIVNDCTGEYICSNPNCLSDQCVFLYQLQKRASDEPMTVYFACRACGGVSCE